MSQVNKLSEKSASRSFFLMHLVPEHTIASAAHCKATNQLKAKGLTLGLAPHVLLRNAKDWASGKLWGYPKRYLKKFLTSSVVYWEFLSLRQIKYTNWNSSKGIEMQSKNVGKVHGNSCRLFSEHLMFSEHVI